MSGLLEEKSMASIDIQSDNAKPLSPNSSLSFKRCSTRSLYSSQSSEHDDDREQQYPSYPPLDHGESVNQIMPSWSLKRAQKTSRWDSIATQKSLKTPKRMHSPRRLVRMLTRMDLPSIDDFSLSLDSESQERSNSEGTIQELLDDVLAIFP